MDVQTQSFYDNLDEMPIYNFMKCTEGQLHFMFISKKGDVTKDIKDKFSELDDKYCELTASNSSFRYFKLIGDIEFLKARLDIAPLLLNNLLKSSLNDSVLITKELKEWGLKIDLKLDLKPQYETCLLKLTNSKNQLERKSEELKELINKPNKTISLQELKVKLHKMSGINVDLMSTSVTEWIEYWKLKY